MGLGKRTWLLSLTTMTRHHDIGGASYYGAVHLTPTSRGKMKYSRKISKPLKMSKMFVKCINFSMKRGTKPMLKLLKREIDWYI